MAIVKVQKRRNWTITPTVHVVGIRQGFGVEEEKDLKGKQSQKNLLLHSLRAIISISLLILSIMKSNYVVCDRNWGMNKTGQDFKQGLL